MKSVESIDTEISEILGPIEMATRAFSPTVFWREDKKSSSKWMANFWRVSTFLMVFLGLGVYI